MKNNNRSFAKAASILLENYPKPIDFLLFINRVSDWIHTLVCHSKERYIKKDFHYITKVILEKVLSKCLTDGNNQKSIEVLSECLFDLFIEIGESKWIDFVTQVTEAFVYWEAETGESSAEQKHNYFTGISTLNQITFSFSKAIPSF